MPRRSEARSRGPVIASRVFRDGKGNEIIARLRAPLRVARDQWRCYFEIRGLATNFSDYGPGEDSLDALILGLAGLRASLEQMEKTLSWHELEPGLLAIPRFIPDCFGLAAETHLKAVVDKEVTRLVNARRRKLTRG